MIPRRRFTMALGAATLGAALALQFSPDVVLASDQKPNGENSNNSNNNSNDRDDRDRHGDDHDHVTICHHEGRDGRHTITVASSAVPAHFRHGDDGGACNPSPHR